ncbi:uncharacterized protein LOC130049144 isoform X2 [Ostrea edulis]|uniref:uncharacterized protein LOC130049144 isoform X2 n=1 Tax=Ostrea edulis TaxID=37623 RepID=UPI0024AF9A2B|nr:uncharacterized protein LOC130049144 isoform X2 [Ostrea edulis]
MYKLFMTAFPAGLVVVCLILQCANAQDCQTAKLQACVESFRSDVLSAGRDKTRLCSAANTYLNCVNKVVSDCNLDSSTHSVSQAITAAKHELSLAGCGNGASGSVYSILTIVVGICLHRLF